MYKVYDNNGNERCNIDSFEYQGEFMSVSKIVATIKAPAPIDFSKGDYILFRREKFSLKYTPAVSKVSRRNTYGEAFVYENIVFYAASDDLTRCDFLDVVKEDNNIHYTSLPNFTFYAESVQELADRIQANLDRLYSGAEKWAVSVAEGTVSKPHNFSCQNLKCWDALVLANTELDLNFVVNGRSIVIGSVGTSIEHEFQYGKGNGLLEVSSGTNEEAAIVTRLRAYGSTRNLPYRYYNKLYVDAGGNVSYKKDNPGEGFTNLISESMYLPNLMPPMFRDGILIGQEGDLYDEDGIYAGRYRIGGIPGQDVYLDSIDGIEKYGINEGTVFFETDDEEEDEDNIYPSMTGMTAQRLIDAGFDITLDSGDNGNLDEILSAEQMTDDGYLPDDGSNISPSSFTVTLKDIGFDIKDYLTDETAKISFTSGALVGRTFEITNVVKDGKKQILTLTRYLDDDIQWVFPNKIYNAKAGDKFVLLNIYMPDAYVVAAEYRLLDREKTYLAENSRNALTYTPKLDNIFFARHKDIAETIKEGDIFTFSDEDLGLYKSITIATINIRVGNSMIPEYEVTLSEEKDATLVDRITTEVSDSLGKTLLTPSNIVTQSKLLFDKRYARKDIDETYPNRVTFEGGAFTNLLRSIGYIPDFGGSGFSLEMKDGHSHLTVDNAYIRNKATFDTLVVRKVTHTGGVEIKSPASCEIAFVGLYYPRLKLVTSDKKEFYVNNSAFRLVSSKADAYKCYFKATDGEKTITNDWQAGDLALCHEYNLSTGARYYWRKVIDVSSEPENGCHWVALSYSDCDGDDAPMPGDAIVCLGSEVADRQNAIIIAANGSNAPSLTQLREINTFNITDSNIVTLLSPSRNIIRGNEIYLEASGEDKNVGTLIDDNTTAIGELGKSVDGNTNAISDNTRMIAQNTASLKIQNERISSVVNKTSQAYDFYSFSDFTYGRVFLYLDTAGMPLGIDTDDDSCIFLHLRNVKKGDRIHLELKGMFASFYTCDNNADDADRFVYDEQFEDYNLYEWKGFCNVYDDKPSQGELEEYDFVANEDAENLYILITDDSAYNWDTLSVAHVKAAVSAESRIIQTADEITAKVGDCGININTKTIELNAERTTINGNLDIQKVSCYYKDANGNDDKTKPMSEYNGTGNGTLVYYYPNGRKMREDVFRYDENGNVIGLWTIYYKTDGTVAWQLTETGFLQTLEEYWSDLGKLHYTTSSLATLKTLLKQYAQNETNIIGRFSQDDFSMYNAPTDTSKYKQYSGKIAKGKMYNQTPDTVTLFDGILIYDISIVSQRNGIIHYEAVYMQVSRTLGVVSIQESYKFNSLGGDD